MYRGPMQAHLDVHGDLEDLLHLSALGRLPQPLAQQQEPALSQLLVAHRAAPRPLEQVARSDEAVLARKHVAALRTDRTHFFMR